MSAVPTPPLYVIQEIVQRAIGRGVEYDDEAGPVKRLFERAREDLPEAIRWEAALEASARIAGRFPRLTPDDIEHARETLGVARPGEEFTDAEIREVAAELHSSGGVPLFEGRCSTADELDALRFAETGVPDDRSPKPLSRTPSQDSIIRALYRLRTAYKAPSFLVRRCGNIAVDGLACRAPLKLIPIASTDRNDPKSERWKLVQSIAGASPFFAWPVRWHVYVAVGPLTQEMRKDADRTEARELLRASADEFCEAVVAPAERKLREAGFGGHTVVWVSPWSVTAVVVTDAAPETFLGGVAVGRRARTFFHDAAVDPIRNPADAERWLGEIVERVMSHHRHVRGEWWDEIVEGMAISAFKNNRSWGYALIDRVRTEDSEFSETRCPDGDLMHPTNPVIAAAAVADDFYPYSPGGGTWEGLLVDRARELRERLRRAGKSVPWLVSPSTGPPDWAAG